MQRLNILAERSVAQEVLVNKIERRYEMITNKKGMSGIVVTIIIIGIALAAVGVVWYVLNVVIEEHKEEVTNASSKVYQDCVPAGYEDYDDTTHTCPGTVKYVGGNMCCTATPVAI